MRHPTSSELLELHFGELRPGHGDRLRGHLLGCEQCRRLVEDVAAVESALREPETAPPADGLAHLLARVAFLRPTAPRRRLAWLRPALPSAAAILIGALVFGVAGRAGAAAFFAAGSLVTLSLAPALILEARGCSAATR
jgi:hypothetical protein